MKKITLITILSIILAGLITLGILTGKLIKNNRNAQNYNKVYYIISKKASIEKLALDFEAKGVIKNKNYFIIYCKLKGLEGNIKSSNIIIQPQINLKELLYKLRSGESDFIVVTIPEGFTLYQIGERLEKNKLADKNSFINISLKDLSDEEFLGLRNNIIHDLEGLLFPDTYYIPKDFSEKDTANLMYNTFKTVFSKQYINRTKELGLSINEIVTIASLIEREAANDKERSRISGVIYNRLKRGMLLQIDAAVIYANTKGERLVDRVLYSDLKINSKYNTYLYKGLPPGPIASPGKASIEAALYPENNDYLYYVAGEGGHVFSKTYDEHQANIKKYLK